MACCLFRKLLTSSESVAFKFFPEICVDMQNEFNQPVGDLLPNWQPPPFPEPEVLQGSYARLEPLDAGRHSKDLFEANSQAPTDHNWTYLSYGPFDSLETYSTWVESASKSTDPQYYSILDQGSQKPLGVASYLRIAPEHGSIEVGHIHYSPRLKGTVAATEAMFLMMQRAFELGYRRYEWKCDALNMNSRRAAQRLGFSFEGIFRQATIYKGRNRDTAWFAIIDREWPLLKDAFVAWLEPANFDQDGTQKRRLSELTATVVSKTDPDLETGRG